MEDRILIIIPFLEEKKISRELLEKIINSNNHDILFIDDRNNNLLYKFIENYPQVKYIKHENPLGYGACFISGYNYAKDFDYDIVITFSPENRNFSNIISEMIININYGYDIINCSRILENYDHQKIPKKFMEYTEILSEVLKEITRLDLTDPLSEIKAFRVKSLANIELCEFTHGLYLQMWIQSSFYELNIFEIPYESIENVDDNIFDENTLDYYLSLIETEKYLYQKGKIN